MFAGSSLIAWVLGDSMRYRRGYYASLEDRAARLERERDAQAQIAAAAERARIARELHDVIAHNVSVMVVQADGASYALDSSPERARQALGAIASTGRQALAEMRRMLGVLRSDDGTPGVVPLPGIGQLGELLEQTRASGLAVSFTVAGRARAAARRARAGRLPDRAGIPDQHPQARRPAGHAPRCCCATARTCWCCRSPTTGAAWPRPDGAGHGLTGMRERVALYGGTLHGGTAARRRLPGHGHGSRSPGPAAAAAAPATGGPGRTRTRPSDAPGPAA